jgi:NTP pyrophosphatase (non-canonical NTP hydrolase)
MLSSRAQTEVMELERLRHEVEVVSDYYAERHNIERTDDWLVLKLNEEVGELTQAYLARVGQARDKGRTAAELESDFRAELADVLAQVLLLAHRFDVNLAEEVERKWLVWRRPDPQSSTSCR